MPRFASCLFILIFWVVKAQAQPPICPPGADMATDCNLACIICDIDGFMGYNEGNEGGQPPPGYCTFAVHDVEWIGFIAGTTDLSLQVSVSNCNGGGGNGLEAGIYLGVDCQNYSLVSNCETNINNNTSVVLSNTVPLVVGQYYWLVMDSNGGNACDFQIDVVSGSTAVPPLSPIPAIFGNTTACPGETVDYSINPVSGAPQIDWTLDGAPVGSGENASVNFPFPGNFQVCVEASNACYPSVSLCTNVTVAPIPPTDVMETICLGDCFIAGDGTSLCGPGVFPIIFTSFGGCDSIVNYIIDVIQVPATLLEETICDGQNVTIGTETFSTTGIHTVSLLNYQDCDSTVVLNLTVEPAPSVNLTEEICAGEAFILGTETYTETGIYQQVYSSWLNCDSTITLDLTVSPADSVYLTESICDGENLMVGAQSFNATGSYEVTLENTAGCDSTIFLDLTVNDSPTTNLTEEICDGESYSVGNETFTMSGMYSVILMSAAGCDSTVNLDLAVVNALMENLNEQICDGQSYSVGNETFTSTGMYEVTLLAASGCDSIVNLDLQVLTVLETNLDEIICEGESFEVGAESFSSTGNYQVDLVSTTGCDSIVYLDLEVFPLEEISLSENICEGESIEISGQTFDQSGQYTIILPAANGCDTTINLDLTVNLNPTTLLEEEICDGESYTVGSQSFTSTGVFEVTLPAANGCDSVVTLDLAVLTVLETELTEQICTGQTFTVGSEVFDQSGVYEVPFTSSTGCDSIVTLDLTVTEQLVELLTETVCFGGTFSAGGQVFDQTGFFEIPLTTPDGCDSLIQLDLTVEGEILTPLPATVCNGESFTVGGQVFGQSGMHEVVLTAANGCDSTVMLDLLVLDEIVTPLPTQICEGQTYAVGAQTFDQTGAYEVTLTSAFGCDSTVMLDLEVTDFLQTNLTESICEGEVFEVGAEVFDATGNYQVDFVTSGGCDSLVLLDLTVLENPQIDLFESICEGEEFPVGTQFFDQTGQYEVVLSSVAGCDSTVNLDLMVMAISTENITAEICDGEQYTVGNQQFTQAGIHEVTLTAASGCDSVVTLNLSLFDCDVEASLTPNPVNCHGDSDGSLMFTVTNGTAPFDYSWERIGTGAPNGTGTVAAIGETEIIAGLPAGNYSVTITGADGYFQEFNAEVMEPDALTGSLQTSQFGVFNLPCFGDEKGFVNASVNGGVSPYQYIWNNGASTQNLESLGVGNYSLTVTDANDCPLELSTILTAPPPLEWLLNIRRPDCTEPLGFIEVPTVNGGAGVFSFSLNGSDFAPQNNFPNLPPGGYALAVQDDNGCRRDTNIQLLPPPQLVLSLGDDLTIDLGDEIQLNPIVFPPFVQFGWEGEAMSCDTCRRPVVSPLQTNDYQLTISTLDGCTASDELTVFVRDNRTIYVPNAFSPNGDGFNDVLTIFSGSQVASVRSFRVFSRWGENVFEYYNFPPNDAEFGWDGSHRGEEMQPAVFVWMAEVEFVDGVIELFRGDVVLVK